MLCITREAGETISIGDAVVSFLSVRGGRVRVGIEAPGLKVLRGELQPIGEPTDAAAPPGKEKKGGGDERA